MFSAYNQPIHCHWCEEELVKARTCLYCFRIMCRNCSCQIHCVAADYEGIQATEETFSETAS